MSAATPNEAPDEHGGHVVIGGRYVLGDILGTGGTYTVYEATRLALHDDPDGETDPAVTTPDGAEPDDTTPLLVKVLHPHLVDDDVARAALAREIAASELVDHPGVVKVLDTGTDEVAGANVPWVVTRRLPGTPLSDLAAGTGLPWPEALVVVAGLLDALDAVHAAGLVHRDVGPRNVVVERHEDGTATVGLLDLGLTAAGGGDGDGALVAGSAAYMSPEQAQGRPLDARSDLYSVGALAYFALTGHAPYERATPADVMRAQIGAPVPAPSARRASVPAAVDRFVAQAMAKNPARRFESAATMGAALTALLGVGGASVAADASPDDDATQTLDQISEDDPNRTAVVGLAAAAAAGAALTAVDDQAEIGRTRQLGAVTAEELAASGEEAALDDDLAAAPAAEDEDERRGFFARPWGIALLVVLGLLVVGGLAFALWPRDDAAEAPVPVVSPSSSPSPSRSASPTPSREPERPSEPTSGRTSSPTPSPSASSSQEPSTEPTPTSSPTPSSEPTEEPTQEPTTEPTEEPTSDPTPTEEPTTEPTDEPEPTEEPTTAPTEEAGQPEEPAASAAPTVSTGGAVNAAP